MPIPLEVVALPLIRRQDQGGLDVGWGSTGDVEDLQQTYQELTARGVQFPQPPVQQPFGWWSLFADSEGNRFALVPRDQ